MPRQPVTAYANPTSVVVKADRKNRTQPQRKSASGFIQQFFLGFYLLLRGFAIRLHLGCFGTKGSARLLSMRSLYEKKPDEFVRLWVASFFQRIIIAMMLIATAVIVAIFNFDGFFISGAACARIVSLSRRLVISFRHANVSSW